MKQEQRKALFGAAIARKERDREGAVVGGAKDFLSSANDQIANFLGLPADIVGKAVEAVGGPAPPDPEGSRNWFRSVFRQLGLVDEHIVDDAISKLGAGVGAAAPAALTLGAGAPAMAATVAKGPISATVKTIGESILKSPGTFVGGEVGAVAGGQAASDLIGPGAAVPGAVAGGALGTGATALVRGSGRLAMGITERIGSSLGSGLRSMVGKDPLQPPPAGLQRDPVRPPGGSPEYAKEVARQTVAKDLTSIEETIRTVLDAVPGNADPKQPQIALRRAVEEAKRVARKEETRYWEGVPVKKPSPTNEVNGFIDGLLVEMKNKPEDIPQDMVDLVRSATTRTVKRGGQLVQVPVRAPIERLLSLRTTTRRARLAERKGDAPNAGKVRAYVRLENALLDQAKRGLTPAQLAKYERAADFSDRLHDTFSEGPVSRMLAVRESGEPRVKPGQSFKGITNEFEPTESLQGVQRFGEGIATTGKTPVPGQALSVEAEAEATVRSWFREAADADPKMGAKWLKKNESLVAPLARVSEELRVTSATIGGLLSAKQAVTTGALTKFINTTPDAFARSLLNSPDPSALSRQIVGRIGGDREALEGLQVAVIDELLKKTGAKGANLTIELNTPRVRNMLGDVLSDGQLSRLNRIAEAAYQLEQGKENALIATVKQGGLLLSRLAGAAVGRRISKGTIQGPGIVSNVFKRAFEAAVARTPTADLVKAAIVDPRWERILMRAAPRTLSEARSQMVTMRRFLAFLEGTRAQAEGNIEGSSGTLEQGFSTGVDFTEDLYQGVFGEGNGE